MSVCVNLSAISSLNIFLCIWEVFSPSSLFWWLPSWCWEVCVCVKDKNCGYLTFFFFFLLWCNVCVYVSYIFLISFFITIVTHSKSRANAENCTTHSFVWARVVITARASAFALLCLFITLVLLSFFYTLLRLFALTIFFWRKHNKNQIVFCLVKVASSFDCVRTYPDVTQCGICTYIFDGDGWERAKSNVVKRTLALLVSAIIRWR